MPNDSHVLLLSCVATASQKGVPAKELARRLRLSPRDLVRAPASERGVSLARLFRVVRAGGLRIGAFKTPAEFGREVDRRRRIRGLTVQELALMVGVHRRTVSRLIRGTGSVELAIAVAEFLQIPFDPG